MIEAIKIYSVKSSFIAFLLLMSVSLGAQNQASDMDLDSVLQENNIDAPVQDTVVTTYEEQNAAPAEEIAYEPDTAYLRSLPSSYIDSLKKDKAFAYANDPEYWKKEESKPSKRGFWDWFDDMLKKKWVRILIWLLLGGAILFAILKIIVENKLFLFYSPAKKAGASEVLLETELMSVDLDEKIRAAESEKDLRLATRYRFLKVLQNLNEKKLISYDVQMTNSDYIRQMKQHHRLKEFRLLARIYDYVWYGEFEPNEQQYGIIKNNFEEFHRVI